MLTSANCAGVRRRAIAALLAAPLGLPLAVQAQQQGGTPSPTSPAEAAPTQNYWTPDRLRSARPPQLPSPANPGPQGMPQGAQIEGPELTRRPPSQAGEQGEGSPPSVDSGESLRRPFAYEGGNEPTAGGT